MNKQINFFIAIIALLVVSCAAPKHSIQYNQLALNSYNNQDYSQAVIEWNSYITSQLESKQVVDPKAYAELGKNYFMLKKYAEAENNFTIARNEEYGDPDMYIMLSKLYKKKDNLSKEITALEYYRDHYPLAKDSIMVGNRLFETSLESENWEQAESIWAQMDDSSKNEEKYLSVYFEMNKQLENKKKCDIVAKQLLNVNSKNHEALEWMAKKYYYLAENHYQDAMAKYNKKKTNKNYKILLKELDQVTNEFKKSLKYFEVLWQMEDGKKYAKYFANIYARFNDKKKSQYYKKLIKTQ